MSSLIKAPSIWSLGVSRHWERERKSEKYFSYYRDSFLTSLLSFTAFSVSWGCWIPLGHPGTNWGLVTHRFIPANNCCRHVSNWDKHKTGWRKVTEKKHISLVLKMSDRRSKFKAPQKLSWKIHKKYTVGRWGVCVCVCTCRGQRRRHSILLSHCDLFRWHKVFH